MSAIREVLYGDLRRASHVFRFSALPNLVQENVAEHAWWTAIIGVTIAAEVGLGPEDQGLIALRSIIHDVEECGTGDLVRTMKYFDQDTREAIGKVERAFAHQIFERIGGRAGDHFEHLWITAKDMKDPCGQIVALADLLCVISKVRWEQSLGNTRLDYVERDCTKLIDQKFGDNKLLLPIVAEALRKGGGDEWDH